MFVLISSSVTYVLKYYSSIFVCLFMLIGVHIWQKVWFSISDSENFSSAGLRIILLAGGVWGLRGLLSVTLLCELRTNDPLIREITSEEKNQKISEIMFYQDLGGGGVQVFMHTWNKSLRRSYKNCESRYTIYVYFVVQALTWC